MSAPAFGRVLTPLLIVAGLLGLAAAMDLAIEKYKLLANPLYVPSCTLSETFSCGSVMRSSQSEAFGFPNPLLGIAGFSVLAASGVALAGGALLPRFYWLGLQAGLTGAVVFVHWLIFQTLYRIEALCPYCMVVWAVTIPAFWYVTLKNLCELVPAEGPGGRAVALLARNHMIVLTVWMLGIAALVVERFWI